MCTFEIHVRSNAGFEGFLPTECAKAPAISGGKARKPKLDARSAEVIPSSLGKGEKSLRHYRADGMVPSVCGSGIAATVSKETGHRPRSANAKRPTENISRGPLHLPFILAEPFQNLLCDTFDRQWSKLLPSKPDCNRFGKLGNFQVAKVLPRNALKPQDGHARSEERIRT